ncbi:MAG: class A beta-lactamase-related serine hydrolase [Candidatus Gracilibacteria bacterium]|nr:class A beta-lactamase-related serine hydrolase [Candidatus Gracilibacteria bacterium]
MKFSDTSYYFRLLKNGSTFGYNEKKEFIPASLIKMPLAIAYFKLSESNPELLKKKVLIDKLDFNVGKRNIGEDNVKIGNTYTIYELIENMLINSDNIATVLLFDYIGEKKLKEVYSELGLKNIDFHNPDSVKISSKDYSSFFRILYNSSYLNRNSSETILSILSKSSFKIGLRALLPKDLIISNKFGERGIEKSNETQLHDCGIIYANDNPYILCVMTKGEDFKDLAYIIENISKIVYENIVVKN